jgi:alpha-N-arabinofuranosidase
MQGMNVGALRYPGGEKSDAYLWARGPDFTGPPDPQPSRVSSLDWPSNDPTFYDRARGTWQTRIMDFDSFMAVAGDAKLHAEPYIVLNVRLPTRMPFTFINFI